MFVLVEMHVFINQLLNYFLLQVIPTLIVEIPHLVVQGPTNFAFLVANTFVLLGASISSSLLSRVGTQGWRYAFALISVPLLVLFGVSLRIPEPPISLLLRGSLENKRLTLQNIRGLVDVEAEFREILIANRPQSSIRNSLKELHRPASWPAFFITLLV